MELPDWLRDLIEHAHDPLALGMRKGDVLPGIGDAMAIEDVHDAASAGNYGEASMLGLLGILGTIPGVGDLASSGVKGAAKSLGIIGEKEAARTASAGVEPFSRSVINERRTFGKDDRGFTRALPSESAIAETQHLVPEHPDNPALQAADEYLNAAGMGNYKMPARLTENNAPLQQRIARDFEELQDPTVPGFREGPAERRAFESYQSNMPGLMEQVGATDYGDLVRKAYQQMGGETQAQFKHIPADITWHSGDKSYLNSKEMVADTLGRNHLTVYGGGDPHSILKDIDPATGRSMNELFRADHDYFGHSIAGNTFGKLGEENAARSHAAMYSPLAQLGMLAETRGQNSWVNFSGQNDAANSLFARAGELRKKFEASGDPVYYDEMQRILDSVNGVVEDGVFKPGSMKYAAQKSVVLPHDDIADVIVGQEIPQGLFDLLNRR